MKITRLTTTKRVIPLRSSYGISSINYGHETFLIAALQTEDGAVGLADSVNGVPFGTESPSTMLHVLHDHLMPAIEGLDPRDIGVATERMEKAIPGHPMAKAIIDIALHDLAAQAAGVPLYRYLGGAFRDRIGYIGPIGISTTARMEAEAVDFVAKGARTLKVKIGTDPVTDVDRVRTIRAAVGPSIKIRVDANQGCSTDWLPIFRKMEAEGLEYLEQPLPIWNVAGTARLAAALDTPILIDEGIYTPHDLIALIRANAVGAVNIKILKTGLRGGAEIAAIADAAGLPIVVGSMFETGIGTAAGLHFAASLPNLTACTEVCFPLALKFDVIKGEPYSTAAPDCAFPVPQGAGLDVRLVDDVRQELGLPKDVS